MLCFQFYYIASFVVRGVLTNCILFTKDIILVPKLSEIHKEAFKIRLGFICKERALG